MNLSDVNLREREFHNKLHLKNKSRFENIFYKAIYNLFKDFYKTIEEGSEGKTVLDYGCGIGSITEKVARQNPTKIVGVDISDISISKAIDNAKKENLNIEYKVENCENSSFPSESCDLIYGAGILHHLDLEKSAKEINRLLKKNGEMILMEPLGTNPLINFYRKLTPKARSEDEHPFTKKDFIFLEKLYGNLSIKYYGFFTLVFFPFYRHPEKSKFYNFLSCLDNFIFKIKFFRIFAWSVLIIGKKI